LKKTSHTNTATQPAHFMAGIRGGTKQINKSDPSDVISTDNLQIKTIIVSFIDESLKMCVSV